MLGVGQVLQDGKSCGGCRLSSSHIHTHPIVPSWILVCCEKHGVGLPTVDVQIVHHKRLNVAPVSCHYCQVMVL